MKRALSQIVTILLIASVLCSISLPAAAVPFSTQDVIDCIENRKNNIGKSREELQAELDTLTQDMESAKSSILNINQQVEYVSQEIAYTQMMVDQYSTLVGEKKEELKKTKEEEERQNELLYARVRTIEEYQKATIWEIMLNATSLEDFITRLNFVNEILTYDKTLLQTLADSRKEIADAKYDLELSEADYQNALAELKLKKKELNKKNEELTAALDKYQAEYDEAFYEFKLMTVSDIIDSTYEDYSYYGNGLDDETMISYLTAATTQLFDAGVDPDEIETRIGMLKCGLEITGKVNYFWGGRTYYPGWNDDWGTMKEVQHSGSKSQPLGSIHPYGLDCSGFVFWCALTYFGEDSWNSPAEWMSGLTAAYMYYKSTPNNYDEKLPGDIVVNADLTHIGFYLCEAADGTPLFLHCGTGGVHISPQNGCSFSKSAVLNFNTN